MKTGFFLIWTIAASIALAFALKPEALELGFEGSDKILHMLAFMFLTILPVVGLEKIRSVAIGIVLIFAIGIGVELAQLYIPSRYADVTDAIFNLIGVLVGTMIGLSLRSTYQSLAPALNVKSRL